MMSGDIGGGLCGKNKSPRTRRRPSLFQKKQHTCFGPNKNAKDQQQQLEDSMKTRDAQPVGLQNREMTNTIYELYAVARQCHDSMAPR